MFRLCDIFVCAKLFVHSYDFHLCPANRDTRSRQSSPPETVGGYGRLGYGTKILSTHTLTVSSYGERRLSYVPRLVGIGRRRKRGSARRGGGRWTEGGQRREGVARAGERDRKESGVTYRRNKCARVMLMANMVEEI